MKWFWCLNVTFPGDGGVEAVGRVQKKERRIFKWSNSQILQLTDDLLYKLQVQRSKGDTGGVDQEQMVRLGGFFMERALGIETRRAPFLVDTNGNCLSLSLSFLSNQTRQRN